MMRRKLVCAIALAGALQAGLAHAVGLGQIELRSALNQPLDADITLINVGDLDGSQIFVKLASPEDFDRAGVDRDYFLTSIRFDASIDRRSGQGKVRLRTREAVREPFLNFVIEARWPNGRVLREYTILLDLPVTQGLVAAPRSSSLQPGVSTTAAATQQSSRSAPVTATRQVSQAAPVAARPSASRIAEPVGTGQHRIQTGETLWEIARRVRPGDSVSVQQTMLTLQAMNPEAFFNNNINQIKAGYVLRLPAAADVAGFMSQQEALQEVAAQNQAWREGRRDRALPTRTSAPASAAAETGQDPVEGRLELSAAATTAAASGAGTAEGAIATGGPAAETGVVRETLVAAERENLELQQNLERMQEQVQTLERLVELKDEQMASLQDAPAAPPQPKAAAAQPASAESGWSSWLIYIGAGLLALFAVVAFLFSRRNKSEPEVEIKPVLVARTGVHPTVSATGVAAAQADTEAVAALDDASVDDLAAVAESVADAEPEAPDADLTTRPSMAPVAAPTEAQTGDAVGEADIYISLGRYAQAASLLKNALAGDPDNSKLHLKLLSVYVAADDRDAFRAHFESIQGSAGAQTIGRAKELLLGVDDPAAWMGEKRDTLEMPPVSLAETDTDTVMGDAIPDDGTLLGDDTVSEFDAVPEASTNTREMGVVELDDTGEFDFSSFGAKEAEQAVVEEDTLDLGNTDDLDFLAETDEASTKLDLARAYIDMGDVEGAREILQEVIQDGDGKAKDEARKLLDSL